MSKQSKRERALREALDNSQSLLVAMLLEPRPVEEIEQQILENRDALGPPLE